MSTIRTETRAPSNSPDESGSDSARRKNGGGVHDGGKSTGQSVRTLIKALDILDTVGTTAGLSVAEIATAVGLNRTTTHRLVQTLAACDYLQLAPEGRGYTIGLRVLPLAAQQLDNNRVRLAALPHLNALAQKVGERVNLGMLFGDELLYLAGVEKPSLPNMYSRFGKRAPVHCCSLGKAIVSFLPESEIDAIITRRPLIRQTPNTIVDPVALHAELSATRARGYAIDNQEHLANTFCIAVPIFDGGAMPVAAVGISGANLDKVMQQVESVRMTAEIVTHILSPARPT